MYNIFARSTSSCVNLIYITPHLLCLRNSRAFPLPAAASAPPSPDPDPASAKTFSRNCPGPLPTGKNPNNQVPSPSGYIQPTACQRAALQTQGQHQNHKVILHEINNVKSLLILFLCIAEIGWRPTPEKNIETMPCWAKIARRNASCT